MRHAAGNTGLVVWSGGVSIVGSGGDRKERRAAHLYLLEKLEPRVLLSAGDLDGAFGTSGKVLTSLTGGFDAGTSAIVLTDGKVLVGGRVTPPGGGGAWLALARYNSDGSLDDTFGDGGTTIVEQDAAGNGYVAMALDGDGDILVATDLHRAGQMTDFGLFRFSAEGELDGSFGADGVVRTDVSTWDIPESIGVRADGKIVVGGWARTPGFGVDGNGRANDKSQGVVIRYNANGTLDSGFGDDGVVSIAAASDMDWVMGKTVMQADGSVLFAGNTSNLTTQAGHAILEQVDGNGDITELPFGNTGDGDHKGVKDVQIDSQGRIVLLLTTSDASQLARFNADGSSDDSFGSGGWVNNDFAVNPDATIQLAGDDSILLAGQEGGGEGAFILSHYLSDGSIDSGFGDGGVVSTAFDSGHGEVVRDVVLTDDGKIVAVGENGDNQEHESKFLVARYEAGDWGGSGHAGGSELVESSGSAGKGSGGSSSESGGSPALAGGAAPTFTPFSLSTGAGDDSIFGKREDLLGSSDDLF